MPTTPPASLAAEGRIAPLPRNLLDAMRCGGIEPQTLATALGLDPNALESGLNFHEADRFMCAAWAALADPAFGLRAGSVMRPERFGIVGIAAMSSPTFGAGIERIARYNRLIWGDMYELRYHGLQGTVRLAPAGSVRPYSQGKIDMELVGLLTFGRHFTGKPVSAQQITLRQPMPSYHRQYDVVFGCPVVFSQPDDSISFSTTDLALPLISNDPELASLVVRGAEAALQRLGDGGLQAQVHLALRRMLRGDQPTVTAVAAELCMSERTLQRRLSQLELRFTDLLDRTRREVAQEHLSSGRVSLDEVAFLLGFATRSSFFRAFKRWTGQTPDRFRRTARASPP